jgi:hypothetical protein
MATAVFSRKDIPQVPGSVLRLLNESGNFETVLPPKIVGGLCVAGLLKISDDGLKNLCRKGIVGGVFIGFADSYSALEMEKVSERPHVWDSGGPDP